MFLPWPFNLVQGLLEDIRNKIVSSPFQAIQQLWGWINPQFQLQRRLEEAGREWLYSQVAERLGVSDQLAQTLTNWLWSQTQGGFSAFLGNIQAQFQVQNQLRQQATEWLAQEFHVSFDGAGNVIYGGLQELPTGFQNVLAPLLGVYTTAQKTDIAHATAHAITTTAEKLSQAEKGFTWGVPDWTPLMVFQQAENLRGMVSAISVPLAQLLCGISFATAGFADDVIDEVLRLPLIYPTLEGARIIGMAQYNYGIMPHLERYWKYLYHPTLPPVPDALEMFRREAITGPVFYDILAQHGLAASYIFAYNELVRVIPPENVLAEEAVKGILSTNAFLKSMRKRGVWEEDSLRWLQNTAKPLDPGSIMALLRRGVITEAKAISELRANLLSSEAAALFLELREIIPGVQDLITFAVREVISPEDFYAWAEKQGLNRYWGFAYWEAHWRLPAIGTLVDAFHRGAIGEEELARYLVWHDYKPDPRPGISVTDIDIVRATQKTLFTRVDARYAYEFGFWNFDRLVRHFLDLGYEDDAEDMARVQIGRTLTSEKTALETQTLREYREGYILADQLRANLEALGFSPERVEMRVQLANRQFMVDFYKDLEKIYVEQYRDDLITEDDLNRLLGEFIKNDLVRWAIIEREKARKYPRRGS